MAGRQRTSLLVPSPASIHLTNLLENITHTEKEAAIVQQSDKWTPIGMTHRYRKYKEPLMHSLHLCADIIYVMFFACVCGSGSGMWNELTALGDFLSGL